LDTRFTATNINQFRIFLVYSQRCDEQQLRY